VDRIFLDANVLFSAAYRENSGLIEIWRLKGVRLLSSSYAIEEARRNLAAAEQRGRLQHLVEALEILDSLPAARLQTTLPEKDQPILAAAVAGRATHWITGDMKHFGEFFGKPLVGVVVLPPAAYLRGRRNR
jgi:predicted nucleic acid-binding protein